MTNAAHIESGRLRLGARKSAREACVALRLRPAVRQVLTDLVACYGEQKLEAGLIVWPSNMRLCDKTGLAERTIRSALFDLQRQALIAPRDSANRKRAGCGGAGRRHKEQNNELSTDSCQSISVA